MKRTAITGIVMLFATGAAVRAAEEPPKMPAPEKQHEWLKQFVGQWEADTEVRMEPDKPPERAKSTETVRDLGGFWIVSNVRGTFKEKPYRGMMTLGYDPQKKKYVGTWVDSMSGHLWEYEGTVDASGKVLTLTTEGPCPMRPGKLSRFKDTIEFKDKDHRIMKSSIQEDDGKWTEVMTIDSRRKK